MPLLALFVAFSLANLQSPATQFDGAWVAEYRGTTHIRLTLRTTNGVTGGTISLGDMEVDESGAVKKVAEAPKAARTILDARRSGTALVLSFKDGESVEQLQVAVAGDGLELTFILSAEDRLEFAAEGIPIPKPIRLTRAK